MKRVSFYFASHLLLAAFSSIQDAVETLQQSHVYLRVIWDSSESAKYVVFFFHTSFMRNIIQVFGILMKFGDSYCASINQPTKIKTYLFKTCPKTSRTIIFQALFLLLCFVGFTVRNISSNLRINYGDSIENQIVQQPTTDSQWFQLRIAHFHGKVPSSMKAALT